MTLTICLITALTIVSAITISVTLGVSANHRGLVVKMYANFEVFAVLKFVVIKPRIFGSVVRQPVLPWQAVCTPLVVGRFTSHNYLPSMQQTCTIIQYWGMAHCSTDTLCPCDLDLWPIPKLGHVTGNSY